MLLAVLSGFLLAVLAPWLHRRFPHHSGLLLALLPAALFIWFASLVPGIADGSREVVRYPWVPSLDIHFSFLIDGLSLLFALLISGIGFFIFVYAGSYLHDNPWQGRFFAILLGFMASMLGLVLANNLITMFVFWELTSVTSYLLVGFHHENKEFRLRARQGLFVTVAGGMALLTGFILLAVAGGGTYELSELLEQGEAITEHSFYTAILVLILAGAFTKSAIFPFHFWLPNAMAAPTPVSAYLHSATMVKAGVFLLARLHPALGGDELWLYLVGGMGAATMFIGIFLAVRSTGVKQVLAYSTIMALGTLTMLIGVGTEKAMIAAMAFLVAHSLYKGALFMIAGILDHQAGCRDFMQTRGLRRALPWTATAAGLAALSLAGVLPMFGFIAKELMFEAVLEAPVIGTALSTLAVLSAIGVVTVAAIAGIRPWYGPPLETPKTPVEAPAALLAGPLVLASLGLLLGLFPGPVENALLAAAVSVSYGEAVEPALKLWHGINLPLLMSLGSLLLGLALYAGWQGFRRLTRFAEALGRVGPERGYEKLMDSVVTVSAWQTRILQNGNLRNYLMTVLLTLVALLAMVLMRHSEAVNIELDFSSIRLYEYAIAAVLALSVLMAATTSSRLGAVAALGGMGFTVALLYLVFSAPDLGTTQVLVETLTVILLVLVLFRLPRFLQLSSTRVKIADAAVALTVGATMTILVLSGLSTEYHESIAHWYVAESEPSGFGRNIVNVILVDFRTLDTLGEIFVLALAATGVFAMIRFRAEDKP